MTERPSADRPLTERWFLDKFLALAARAHPERLFLDEVAFSWAGDEDYDRPRKLVCDLIEIDGRGRLHLWLFKSVRSPELLGGEMIGRLFACSGVLRRMPAAQIRARLEKAARRHRAFDPARLDAVLARPRIRFDSWNLVACGGQGCELAGGDDTPLWQLYAPLTRMVEAIDDVNTWHFYQTGTGFDLRNLWDFALAGKLSPEQRLDIAHGRADLAPQPDDDFDIASKHDLHLKRKKGFHAQGHQAYFGERRQYQAL